MTQPKNKPSPPAEAEVPKAVVNRLSLYLRELQQLLRGGHETISSSHLGNLLGFSDAQVRKDLAYFGHFGYPGIGYRCEELVAAIRKILGTDLNWPVAMVGAGNLGRALLGYKGFGTQNFRIVAAFDVDAGKTNAKIEEVLSLRFVLTFRVSISGFCSLPGNNAMYLAKPSTVLVDL